jgi:hypothetical protein
MPLCSSAGRAASGCAAHADGADVEVVDQLAADRQGGCRGGRRRDAYELDVTVALHASSKN